MTKSYFAQVSGHIGRYSKMFDVVTQQATNDLLKGIEIAPGIMRGATRKRGTIPRHIGAIARSLRSSLYGSTAASGEASYTMVIGQMRAGDVADFTWGGAVAPHARANHYGYKGLEGTFWIPEAAAKWQGYVDAAVARAKAQVR